MIEKIFRDEAEHMVMKHKTEEGHIDSEKLSNSMSNIMLHPVTIE